MTDRRAEKCPMDPQILEAKRRRKKELHEQAKRDLRARAAGRSDGARYGQGQGSGCGQGQGGGYGPKQGDGYGPDEGQGAFGRDGDWGPPPPWWLQQQQQKKKRKHEQRRRELERKPQEHPLCGGGHGDPLAKKPRASAEPLTVALPGAARGSAAAPILAEEEIVLECFKDKHLHLQIMGSAIPREGFFYMEFEDDEEDVGSDLKAFNGAILFAEPGKLSLRTLKQDLKHMVVGESDWQISQVRDDDFSVVFPSADLLHTAKSRGELFLSVNDITVKVRDTIHEEITPLCRRYGSSALHP
ncbi:hypothetical protein ZWY2020_004287 [Hordeum vulgare]|nr:hypothetical protein ZWY2020_004287 [Hordeum vulgare]